MFLFSRFCSQLLAIAFLNFLLLSPGAFAQETHKTTPKTYPAAPAARKPAHAQAAPHKKNVPAPVKKTPAHTAHPATHTPAKKHPHTNTNAASPHPAAHAHKVGDTHKMCKMSGQHTQYHKKGKVLQCVGYVHLAAPHFKIRGDAHTWWKRADDHHYAKGQTPEPGAVLSFRATHKMVYGHVAMVRSLVDARTIRIDHAHWGINGIDRNIRCVDVSKNNDWTSVRVAMRTNEKTLGNIYPTNGFIYPWTKEEVSQREKHLQEKPFGSRPTAHVKFKLPEDV